MQDGLELLKALGFTWPSPAYIVGLILFSVLGMVAYYVGIRRKHAKMKWLGLGLMLYPYAVPMTWTWALYLVGTALSAAVWMTRDA